MELPATQNVNAGDTAAYRCKHDTADIIRWRVNGSLIGRNPPPDVTSNIVTDKNGDLDGTLTIVAHLEYNQTEIVCVARFDDGSPEEITSSVLLIIHQGKIKNADDDTTLTIYVIVIKMCFTTSACLYA